MEYGIYYSLQLLMLFGAAYYPASVTSTDNETSTPTKTNTAINTPATTVKPVVTTVNEKYEGYTLRDKDGQICFRAVFSSSVYIKYKTDGPGNTKVLDANLEPGSDAEYSGSCGTSTTNFTLSWAGGNYSLNIFFTQKTQPNKVNAMQITTWAAEYISFTIDTTQNSDLEGIVKSGVFTAVSAPGQVHFDAPANFSYSCITQEDIDLSVPGPDNTTDTSVLDTVTVSLWEVRLQAFEVPQTGVFSESASCKPDLEQETPKQNIVPLVVAACLATLIGIIIVAYFFIKNKANTQYSAME